MQLIKVKTERKLILLLIVMFTLWMNKLLAYSFIVWTQDTGHVIPELTSFEELKCRCFGHKNQQQMNIILYFNCKLTVL